MFMFGELYIFYGNKFYLLFWQVDAVLYMWFFFEIYKEVEKTIDGKFT